MGDVSVVTEEKDAGETLKEVYIYFSSKNNSFTVNIRKEFKLCIDFCAVYSLVCAAPVAKHPANKISSNMLRLYLLLFLSKSEVCRGKELLLLSQSPWLFFCPVQGNDTLIQRVCHILNNSC